MLPGSNQYIRNLQVTTKLVFSVCEEKLKCQPEIEENHKKKRKRNIIRFNLPYNRSVKTNTDKYIQCLWHKQFPQTKSIGKRLAKIT